MTTKPKHFHPVRGDHDRRRTRNSFSLIAICFMVLHCDTSLSAVFTVTSPTDGGGGSLRQAILDANSAPGMHTVRFNIPGSGVQTIFPFSALPTVTNRMEIDATTQPGYSGVPLVELNGANAGAANGITIIAGSTTIRGFIINSFSGSGIFLDRNGTNVIQANYIGTDAFGTNAIGNWSGITITAASPGNIVEQNLISGARNRGAGIAIGRQDVGASSRGNKIWGNRIGTDVFGEKAQPNIQGGIVLYGAVDTQIGGIQDDQQNLISGNEIAGIYMQGGGRNKIQGNLIGTDRTGTNALGNVGAGWGWGIYMHTSESNLVGGLDVRARNVISGNGLGSGGGIQIAYVGYATIQGNLIGTDATGAKALPNYGDGINLNSFIPATMIFLSANNVIGGSVPSARNVISGNRGNGISIFGSGNQVQGNFIGTDVTGRFAISNWVDGVYISESLHNFVGGRAPGEGNLLSGNGRYGVNVRDDVPADGTNNVVMGNLIGTDAAGRSSVGNRRAGVGLTGAASYSRIGGTNTGEGNLISGNFFGIEITTAPFGIGKNNVIQGNWIGTSIDRLSALPNQSHGILITNGPSMDLIGGQVAESANTIAFNGRAGVFLHQGTQHSIRRNSIFGNGGLGIDLGTPGVNQNDVNDSDSGPNNLVNFPMLLAATNVDASTIVTGNLNSVPNSTFALEFFSNRATDSSTFGEGETFVGSTSVTTDGTGSASFSVTLATFVAAGALITATTTDPGGSTSEFSQCVLIGTPRLGIWQTTNNLVLSWTTLATGFRVESATSLSLPLSWSNVVQTPATNSGLLTITLPKSAGNRFYQLAKP